MRTDAAGPTSGYSVPPSALSQLTLACKVLKSTSVPRESHVKYVYILTFQFRHSRMYSQ